MVEDKLDLRGFSLINTYTKDYQNSLNLKEMSDAFYHLILNLVREFNLNEEEISDCITDTNYNLNMNKLGGHDRGIDAIQIQEEGNIKTIRLFNFKFKESFDSCNNFYPSSEIDKINSFLNALYDKDKDFFKDANPILMDRVKEIWEILNSIQKNQIKFYFCSNGSNEMEKSENERVKKELRKKGVSCEYILGPEIAKLLSERGKIKPSAKIKFIGKESFDKSDGDVKAVIANVDARDVVRIVLEDENLRDNAVIQDYEEMRGIKILNDSFEDNIRIYQQQRGKINQNIKRTALDESKSRRFFYFNNGITITCSKISYNPSISSPIATIEDLQIVNGCQTIYSLHDAFQEDPSKLENINVLCKIYETINKDLSLNIAEFTNSQNTVNNRDIKSVDYSQIVLETELLKKGYFYERKKGMYKSKPNSSRIDAEKAGQLILSFFNEMPAEAKNKKSIIFETYYDKVFNEDITADSILLVNGLYERIELKKQEWKEHAIKEEIENSELESFILHASFYLMYVLRLESEKRNIPLLLDNLEKIFSYYDESYKLIKSIVEKKAQEENYSHGGLFKSPKLKELIKDTLRE